MESSHFLDIENYRQFYYQAMESYAYETFLNKCEDDNNVILDGSEKAAAYISPENGSAYVLLGLDEIKRGAKLYVRFSQDNSRVFEESEITQLMKDVITAEIARFRENIVITKQDKFWTDGAYSSVKLLSYSLPGLTIIQDLPETVFHFEDGVFCRKAFCDHGRR